MTLKIYYGFALGQSVKLVGPDVVAKIDAVMNSIDGLQYRVCFWVDSARRVEWVYPSEIESLQKQNAS